MLRIGNLVLKNNLLLAPLAGITNAAFRLLCKDYGAALTYAPIMNENALLNNYKKVVNVIESEHPIGGQLIGKDAGKLSRAVRLIDDLFDVIDLNLGCPRRKEVQCGIGAVILRKPGKVSKLVRTLVSNTDKPVTIKIRLGFKEINVLDIARIIEEQGASAIIVHARTAMQDYDVKADWEWIKRVKNEVNIPVIGNGDLFTPEDVKRMLDETGCDGVMIARGANGNPFIFQNTLDYLRKGSYSVPTINDRINAFNKLIEYFHKYVNNYSISELKMHAYWFTKGLSEARKLRNKIFMAKNEDELKNIFNSLIS